LEKRLLELETNSSKIRRQRAYELLLKVPRTPTFGISPEKKLVDRFLGDAW
jgi:hypothetical protein